MEVDAFFVKASASVTVGGGRSDSNTNSKTNEKKVKKELSSDIKVSEDKKKKSIKNIKDKKNILCGFPLITKKGEKCTNKGLLECGGRCKMHNGK